MEIITQSNCNDNNSQQQKCSSHQPTLAVVVLLVETELTAGDARAGEGEVLVLDVGEVGHHQHHRHHPAQGQQQGGRGAGVAGEEEFAVPDEVPGQQDEHAEVRGPVLCLCMKVSRLLTVRIITVTRGNM